MLKLLKRWLGWDSDSGPFDFSALQPPPRPRPTPASRPAAPTPPAKPEQAVQRPAPARKPKNKERAPADVLHNPSLTLDKPGDDGFDPYNTGAFNRSTSWERIGRSKKR